MMLTGHIITKITPSIKGKYACDIADALSRILPLYGMADPDIFHEFWANVLEESWEMGRMTENLNYKVESLIEKFGRHRISIADAKRYGRIDGKQKANQPAIANCIYGGKWAKLNLGNFAPTHGWDLRGSGPMQLTGFWMIAGFRDYYAKRFGHTYTVEQMAHLLRTDLEIGLHSACWVFAIAKKLIPAAISKNLTSTQVVERMKYIVEKINGGHTNLRKRLAYYEDVKMNVM